MIFCILLLVCWTALISIQSVNARFRCHNRCSGHGYCSDYDNICYCKAGYQGVDCSERTCPLESAWADKAYKVDMGHQWVECSNAGRCNMRTGVCECSPGYTGIACERTKCGGSGDGGCNGHGDCITLGQTYQMVASYAAESDNSIYSPTFYDPEQEQFPAWEATHVTMCSCHPGFSGASCEYRLCPKGDDPMTPHTGFRTITIQLHAFHALAELTGRFLFVFNGESLWFPAGASLFTAAQCEAAFEALRNIDDVSCAVSTSGDNSVTYTVQLRKFPALPVETSIYTNDGNPPLSAFVCNLDEVVMYSDENQVFCTVDEVHTDKIYPEYAPCSNRGICDFTSGVCFCFQQFSGANCANYKKAIAPPVQREVSTNEVFTVESSNPEFKATILRFQTFDVASSDFKTINVNNLDRNVFSLDGAGNVNMNYGSLVIGDATNVEYSGMTVNAGGLTVTGGVTAYTDTLVINGPTYVTTGGVTVMNGGLRVIGTAEFNGDAEIFGGFSVARGLQLNGGLYVGAGGGTFSLGGLSVNGGLTIASAGLTVNRRGVTILSGGLVVSGGIQLKKVKSGLTVDSAVSVLSDGVSIAGGLTVLTGGVVTDSGLSINSGGLVVAELNMQGGGMTVSGGITVQANGMSVTGGITVVDQGVSVDSTTSTNNVAGGVTIFADGLVLPDALTIYSGGVVVTGGVTVPVGDVNIISTAPVNVMSFGAMIPAGGLTIYSDGFVITGGVTVNNAGLSVTAGGLSIQGNGLRVYGGLSILSDGGRITGGVTVSTGGVYLNDGISIQGGGLNVYGGVTVQDTGMLLNAGGLSVLNAGVKVTGGATIHTGGLIVSGGLSVQSAGLRTTDGLTVNSGGMRVTGGLTNTGTSSVVINGGLSVNTPGLYSANAMTVYNSGLAVETGLSIQADGAEVLGGLVLSNSGLSVVNSGLSVMSASLWVTGGMTINDPTSGIYIVNSMTVAGGGQIIGGLTVQNSGVQVNNGGVTIASGGLLVTTGGLTVQGGMRAHSLTIANTGVNVAAGGVSTSSGGLFVSASGLTVFNSGLRASGGVFVTDGLRLNGGLSTRSGGLGITNGGLTVFNGGAAITGGMSIAASGFTAAGNMVITTGNLVIGDKLQIGASGLRVANGLTLADIGLTTASTLTVARSGIRTADVIVARNNGVRVVAGDTSVRSLGISVTGGATVSFGGVTFDSSTVSPGSNIIEAGGLWVLGATPVHVRSDGVEVLGDLYANGAVYFSQMYDVASDARLKTQVHRLENALGKLEHVRGVSYNFKNAQWDLDSGRLANSSLENQLANLTDPNIAKASSVAGKLRFVGLIAQELQAVLPEVVKNMRIGEEDYFGVNYADVVSLVIEAVRELDERSAATFAKWASRRSNRRTTQLTKASEEANVKFTPSKAEARNVVSDDELFRAYFTFDKSTNKVAGVRPYNGSCSCGSDALNQMVAMLQRIQSLEAEETMLLAQLNSFKAL